MEEREESLFSGQKYNLPNDILRWAPTNVNEGFDERPRDRTTPPIVWLEPFIFYAHRNKELECLLCSLYVCTGILQDLYPEVNRHHFAALFHKPQSKRAAKPKPHLVLLENVTMEKVHPIKPGRFVRFERAAVRLSAVSSWKILTQELPMTKTVNCVKDAFVSNEWSLRDIRSRASM